MKWLDKELPNFGHRFQGAATQRIGVHGHAAPADDAQALGVRGDFNGCAGLFNDGRRKKGKANPEHFRQINSLLLSAGAKEGLRERSQQASPVAAGSVGINSTAVSEAL